VTDTVVRFLIVFVIVVQPLFLVYFLLYNTYTLWLIALSARQVRRRVAGHFIEDLDLIDEGDLTKPLTMIVPAYNEEVTIVDSVTGLINSDYPRFEIVVVNDGSTDATLERLKRAFGLRRTDMLYRPAIATAPVRAMYEATLSLPKSVMQVIVIDKENGGKADALNAGINASTTPYFVSLDADSILDQRALKELMRVVQEDPKVVANGGISAVFHHRPDRARPGPRDSDPERSLCRVREGDGDPGRRVFNSLPPAPAHRGVRGRRSPYRLRRHGNHSTTAPVRSGQAA
jgi:cellulose synthase/poly-beta-1,6-N-acetylglucosamine synthase-like glycosyltransferase